MRRGLHTTRHHSNDLRKNLKYFMAGFPHGLITHIRVNTWLATQVGIIASATAALIESLSFVAHSHVHAIESILKNRRNA
jgi:hypothetical protein